MKTQQTKKIYETFADHGKLVFRITEGQFAGVEYTYNSMMLNGDLKYRIKTKKNAITENNKMLFESEIRSIIKDKLSKI